jgi:hypothetical protein
VLWERPSRPAGAFLPQARITDIVKHGRARKSGWTTLK